MAQAVLLGILQGLTEFLPVSSSGHLVLARRLFGSSVESPVALDVMLHVGTLFAVLVYFRADLLRLLLSLGGGDSTDRRQVGLLALATLPIVVVGLLFAEQVEAAFSSPAVVGLCLLITGCMLAWAARLPAGTRGADAMRPLDALVIGALQAVAVLPGISRAGATVTAGLGRGLDRDLAARFAFLLSIPAILGAVVFKLDELVNLLDTSFTPVLAGVAASAVTGWLAIAIMMRVIRRGRLLPFALYCMIAGSLGLYLGVMTGGG
jgi:undecaprenyl-diphosphatase